MKNINTVIEENIEIVIGREKRQIKQKNTDCTANWVNNSEKTETVIVKTECVQVIE